ncbi:MAG: NAD-dependent epimerase/dehydratase family protein [Chloroflexi bacterium]|nr:NAD-dependent epimerase/dehydratase family protein [Chloroflexota bacterium]
MPKRILVTGGAGFIGSHLVGRLLELGHQVAVVDDLSTGKREYVDPRAAFYHLDITQAAALGEVVARVRPEVVEHHAAQTSVVRSVADPGEDARTNILGSLSVLEACRRHGVEHVIFASTGGALYGNPERVPCGEEHPVRPLSPYGAAKAAVETYLAMYQQVYGLSWTALRYANVYGPRQDPFGEAGVVSIFTQKMLTEQAPTIFGTGEQQRDFVYVGDVVEANVLALERGVGGVYNIGTGVATSVNRIAGLLRQTTEYRGEIAYGPARPGEVDCIALESCRARDTLGWAPAVTLEEGLARTVAFFRQRGLPGAKTKSL